MPAASVSVDSLFSAFRYVPESLIRPVEGAWLVLCCLSVLDRADCGGRVWQESIVWQGTKEDTTLAKTLFVRLEAVGARIALVAC